MAIENNNPLEQQNNPDRNGSNGDATTASTRRRKKPRRDGKGSNTKTNNPTTTKSGKSSGRRGGKGQAGTDNQALSTAVDPNLAASDAADDAAAMAEGGIKAVGNQRIIPFMKIEKPMALLSLFMVIGSIIAIAVNGLNLGLDFTGGVSADVLSKLLLYKHWQTMVLMMLSFNISVHVKSYWYDYRPSLIMWMG